MLGAAQSVLESVMLVVATEVMQGNGQGKNDLVYNRQ